MSLTELRDSVTQDADHHHPDIIYEPGSSAHSMLFQALDMKKVIDEYELDEVGLAIETDRQDPARYAKHPYMFTRWSRSQLLSFFGVREKWFSFVDLERQASELNARLSALGGYRIRTMRPFDDAFPIHIVRGIVSAEYADIPNVSVMETLTALLPEDNTQVLRSYSGITDRAFYAYICNAEPIAIPNTTFRAYPGVLVRNSEVGHTSLSITPILVTGTGQPVVLKDRVLFRRVHRGRDLDLESMFSSAMNKCAAIWQDMGMKIPALASKMYPDADAAVTAMSRLLTRVGARKDFIARCETQYRRRNTPHNALGVFEAISDVCSVTTDRDENYELSAIAGAVLFRLVLT
jgi:hypothetical protein